MKIKSIWAFVCLLSIMTFIGCSDDLNSIGSNIQPPNDSIYVATDTLTLTAKTVPVDSVYARTINGVLGKYEDDVFGTIQSDYLCQFYYSDSTKFKTNVESIDSVKFSIDFSQFSGDSLAPMGLSVYKVQKKLPENFYTNIDPKPYLGNNPELLASTAYTINGAPKTSTYTSGTTVYLQRAIRANLDTQFGVDLHKAYEAGTIKNKDTFNEYLKGMYVTTTFGSGTLIDVIYTSIDIYYKWKDIKGNYDKTNDTIRTSLLSLSVTPEVLQLNHIKNENPKDLFIENTGQTYMKTPAGVFTQIEFPIKEISENMQKKDFKIVTSAQFSLKGYTEKESSDPFGLGRPNYVLLIDKDSVNNFFTKRQLPDGKSSLYTSRNSTYNTYNFNNISTLINHYRGANVDKVTFLLIPVDVTLESTTAVGVYNYLKPSTSILRSDSTNMRLDLIYSRFNNQN